MSESQARSDNVVPLPHRLRDDPQAAVSDFVRDHPLLVIAGGVAVGVLVSALLPKGAARRVAGRAIGLAEIAGAASVAFGKDAWDKAETAGSEIGKRGSVLASDLADRAGDLASRAGNLGRAGAHRASDAGSAAAERIGAVATPATQAAADFAELVADKAAEIAARFRRR